MKTYKLRTQKKARIQLQTIYEYIAEDSVTPADKWYLKMMKAIASLQSMPERCPVAEESALAAFEIRHLIVGNYRVLFRIHQEAVQILHIRHSAQDRKLP